LKLRIEIFSLNKVALLNSNFTESITQFERAIKSGHLSESESIASHLKLAQAYQKNGQFIEAARITDDIERTFSDASSIAGKLALSKAEQALQTGDVSGAISVLENVKYSSGAALAAKKRLALIYLNDRRNEERFIEIHREVCQNRPGEFEPLVSLGDALIRVNRTEEGIKSYEAALRLRKSDISLQNKIGRAMVITHDYSGAVKYYRKSVATGESSALRIELANLLQKLGLKDQAIEVLLEGTNSPDKGVSGRETEARCFIELCKIKIDSGDRDEALQMLSKAKQITDQLLKKKGQSEDGNESVKQIATEIHCMIGEIAKQNGDLDNSVKFYSKASTFNPNSNDANKARLSLANVYRLKGEHSHAQAVLSKLMTSELSSEASELNAALMCDSGNLNGAIQHYSRMVEKQPMKWEIVAKLIPLLRRSGSLKSVQTLIDTMDETVCAGRSFCLGLFDYFRLNTESAMHHLLASKRSPKWRIPSVHIMIKLCLGLESDELNTDKDAVNLAQQLLQELPQNEPETKMFSNWILLAKKYKRFNK